MLIYHLLTTLLLPIYICLLGLRTIQGKETLSRVSERFARTSKSRPVGVLIWLHAASVGESIIALTLINAITARLPTARFLVTSMSASSASILANKLPPNALHQFAPIDQLLFIKKFLAHWRPNLGIFVESELWPCLINESAKICDLILVNARISDKSFKLWLKFNKFFQSIINNFKEIITQSNADAEKFQMLGLSRVTHLRSIKFSHPKLNLDQEQYKILSKYLANKRVIVAASTHAEDEQAILKYITQLKAQFQDCYFIIVLRHPNRRHEVSKYCQQLGLTFSVRSASSLPALNEDLYIVDSFNELGLFYSIAYIVFIGGSFKQGGHNPIEPAHFGKMIIFGPNMSNCQELANEMIVNKAALQIKSSDELFAKFQYLLQQGMDEVGQYSKNSFYYIQQHSNVLADYLTIINKYIITEER